MGQCLTPSTISDELGGPEVGVEIGLREAELLEHAPRQQWPPASSEALLNDGVIRVENVLSIETTANLRIYLESKLSAFAEKVETGATHEDYFIPVRCHEQGRRHALKLALEPMVVSAIAESLQVLAPFIRNMLGCGEPLIAEVFAVRSTDGAPRQPFHTDCNTGCRSPPGMLTAFVALQDITEEMGPTVFLPATYRRLEAHAAMYSKADKEKLLRATSIRLGTMSEGSCTLYDTHLLHAGGANNSPHPRWLFSMTFIPNMPNFMIALHHVYYDMCRLGVHSLSELERGAVRSEDDVETKQLTSTWLSLLDDDEIKRPAELYRLLYKG